MSEVVSGVYRLGSEYLNCYMFEDGDDVVLIDAGLPAYWRQVKTLLHWRDRDPSDIKAVLLTHSHADHVGFLKEVQSAGAPVYVHRLDAAPGNRRWPPPWPYARPTSWPWAAHAFRAGLVRAPDPKDVVTFEDGDVLDVPGSPRVVHTRGHTRGSACFHFADRGLLFTGDALVTFDPYSRRRGPQVMVDGVNEDPKATRASLDRIKEIDAKWVLPGHGEPSDQGPSSLVERTPTLASGGV